MNDKAAACHLDPADNGHRRQRAGMRPADLRTLERPTIADAGPTEISTSFIVAGILGVDDVSQKIELDLIATFRWQDDRLAQYRGCQFAISDVWFPRMSLINSSQLVLERTNARNQVQVEDGGAILYRQRYTGTISTYHNLRSFPFDRHVFDFEVATLLNDSSEIRFIADSDATWISDRLNIEGWTIDGVKLFSEPRFLRQAGGELSVLTLRVATARDADYFICRVLLRADQHADNFRFVRTVAVRARQFFLQCV